jgi:hypothetical protein
MDGWKLCLCSEQERKRTVTQESEVTQLCGGVLVSLQGQFESDSGEIDLQNITPIVSHYRSPAYMHLGVFLASISLLLLWISMLSNEHAYRNVYILTSCCIFIFVSPRNRTL